MTASELERGKGLEHSPLSKPLQSVFAIALLNNFEVFGQERGNIEWYKALRRLGATVRVGVTATFGGGELRALVERMGFSTFEVPYGCQWSKAFFRQKPSLIPSNIARIVSCSRVLRNEVVRNRATHLLIGNPLVYSFVAPYLSWNRRIKLMYRMGDEVSHDSRPNKWIWHVCYWRANVVVANSEFVKASIRRAFRSEPKKVRLIYNIAPSAELSPQTDELDRSREVTSYSQDSIGTRKRVLYVGQISEHKGIGLLVDAAITLCREGWDWYFDIVGGSRYTQEYERELRERVESAGFQQRICFHGHACDPSPFYRQATVLVVPSLFEEPAANVVLEAKREGIPAIVFPSGGLPELVEDGITGFICRQRNCSELINALRFGFNDPNWFDGMGHRCAEEYSRRFSEGRFDREWADVFSTTE